MPLPNLDSYPKIDMKFSEKMPNFIKLRSYIARTRTRDLALLNLKDKRTMPKPTKFKWDVARQQFLLD